jgi:type II secretory pathway pseudopilin PulG
MKSKLKSTRVSNQLLNIKSFPDSKLSNSRSDIVINKIMPMSKHSQVWVETSIYTLIGLTLIAVVLTVALPQIEKIKDRETIKQTIVALNLLNQKITETREAPSSTRIYDLFLSKGKIEIDCEKDIISYTLENTRLEFSQIGEIVKEGNIYTKTEKYGNRFNVILSIDLSSNTNLMFNSQEILKTLQAAPSPYNIKIYNNATIDSLGRYVVDLSI